MKEEWFKKTPKWKMFFIRLFGRKIVGSEIGGDGHTRSISYLFRGNMYLDKIINVYAITGRNDPKTFSFSKICDPQKW